MVELGDPYERSWAEADRHRHHVLLS